MVSDIRLLRPLACLGLVLTLAACTTGNPTLPVATASIPVPAAAPRTTALTVTDAPVQMAYAGPAVKTTTMTPSAAVEVASVAEPAKFSAPGTPVDTLISQYSAAYAVPESLVRRVVHRESRGRPEARNGKYWGLMQLLPSTARAMGHNGTAKDLLDAETNLKYGVKYLAGAYRVADRNPDQAVRLYSRGYYYQAKRKGMLEETGLKGGTPVVSTQIASLPMAPVPTIAQQQTAAIIQPAAAIAMADPAPVRLSLVAIPADRPF
ncbi:lytic transglycosylase domain-containing protein [Phyllobacterium sp. OV277]|uniref:lytic transglycosylase domain-containing protein n=1 Tax=Phyllobacterium sp. OV277 TaxID=1882772 RepID=UPI00087E62AC|nr:Transglycosylase SLT domain-containing protein [Phyllobacterium sp. OV277]